MLFVILIQVFMVDYSWGLLVASQQNPRQMLNLDSTICRNEVCPPEDDGFLYVYDCCMDDKGTPEAVCCIFMSNAAKMLISIIGIAATVVMIITLLCFFKVLRWPPVGRKRTASRKKVSFSKPSMTNYRMKKSAYNELLELEIPRSKDEEDLNTNHLADLMEPTQVKAACQQAPLPLAVSNKSEHSVTCESPSFSASIQESEKSFYDVCKNEQLHYNTVENVKPTTEVVRGPLKRDDAKLGLPKLARTQSQGAYDRTNDPTGSSISLPPLEQLVPVHESTQNCPTNTLTDSSQPNQASFLATGSLLYPEEEVEEGKMTTFGKSN